MEHDNKYEVLSNIYRNPTKFGVIVLLAEQGPMTVTQMSRYISVSRSNLYHFVSQLVDEGVLNEPEIRPKKNYVEKYYSINEEMFSTADNEMWGDVIRNENLEEIRELMSSVLMGLSMILNMTAKSIAHSTDAEAAEMKETLLINGAPWTATYALISKKNTDAIAPAVKNLQKALEDNPGVPGDNVNFSRLLLIFLPILGGRDS